MHTLPCLVLMLTRLTYIGLDVHGGLLYAAPTTYSQCVSECNQMFIDAVSDVGRFVWPPPPSNVRSPSGYPLAGDCSMEALIRFDL